MEAPTQPPLPPPSPTPRRYGRTILLIVLAPMILLGLGMAVAGGLHLGDSSGYFSIVLLVACLCAAVGSGYICVAISQSAVARLFIFALSAVVLVVVYT